MERYLSRRRFGQGGLNVRSSTSTVYALIIKEDDADKNLQIGFMSREYCFAHVTITAASGTSVRSGLLGFRSGTRLHTQQVEPCRGASRSDKFSSLCQSKYARSSLKEVNFCEEAYHEDIALHFHQLQTAATERIQK
ncbi:hypothetical protein M440DRAFT_1391568 [Trichoderma longibrachiatum ATCC 18648]|uniref:Heterokaryon incompatibility domain-containing protein n=1 Tax=Trichoderma longibrachiatum ATCC 18648 TaxID=983965 RepID=A0A2T4C690_TRILO|nr:hypothetical protein M440DRAFT_1391568 [Trichoderma longibrachiatum ATCC 18648]